MAEINKLIELNKELRKLCDDLMGMGIKVYNNEDIFVGFTFGKSYKTHGALTLLAENGYGQDAAVLARTLFDLLINMLYILKDKDIRLDRYISYDWILRRKMLDYAKNQPKMIEAIELKEATNGNDSQEEIYAKAREAKEKYNYGATWSDKTIEEMSKEVGRYDFYKTIFALQSNLVHSNPRSMREYVSEKNNCIEISSDRDDKWVEEALVIGFDMLFCIIENVSKHFNKSIGNKLQKLVKQLDDILAETVN